MRGNYRRVLTVSVRPKFAWFVEVDLKVSEEVPPDQLYNLKHVHHVVQVQMYETKQFPSIQHSQES